jgi:hypothetical protein
LLTRPKWGVELRFLYQKGERIGKNIVANKAQNLWFIAEKRAIYLAYPIGESNCVSVLQGLPEFCGKLKIQELIVTGSKENRLLIETIKKLKELLRKHSLKVYLIRSAQEVKNKKTREVILNDFHMLPTGAHAGINRMTKNIQRHYV